MTKTSTTEAEAIAALAVEAAGARVLDGPNGRHFLITPEGFTSKEVSDEHGLSLTRPSYIKRTVKIETADSLVDYASAFKTYSSMLFADIASNRILAAIDYHSPEKAENVEHIARLDLHFSEEWALWNSISGKLMAQLEFARFIEENAADVRAPEAGELLDACRDLQVHRKVNFVKAVRTQTDNENFEYTDETNAKSCKGDLELPTKFKLGLPVYFGLPETEVYAFLRWKLDDGQLKLGIQLHRIEHVRQAVFKQIVIDVSTRADVPAVFGSPNG